MPTSQDTNMHSYDTITSLMSPVLYFTCLQVVEQYDDEPQLYCRSVFLQLILDVRIHA